MDIQPIANLDQRLEEYHRECRQFYRGKLLLFAVGSFAGNVTCLHVVGEIFPESKPFNIVVVAALFTLVMLVGPMLLMRPRRPTLDDVHADQALRRAHGLDDRVAR